MKSQEIVQLFRDIVMILELKGDNPFRIRAYDRAVDVIESLGDDLERMAQEDTLTTLPGIGADLASKIKEYLATGTIEYYRKLRQEIPAGVLEMIQIPGLGPKTVKAIYEKLAITTVEELAQAATDGRLRSLGGIKQKTEKNILRGIALLKQGQERIPLSSALSIADLFVEKLRIVPGVSNVEIAGSLRRSKETIGDIDIVVVARNAHNVLDAFTQNQHVKEVIACGATKASIIAKQNNLQVDVRVVQKKSFGSALMYFTGSKQFNIKLRQLAVKENRKVNEYGVFETATRRGKETETFLAGGSEEEIFSLFGMQVIPPELREDRGEIQAALANTLPKLVTLKDIRGDCHVHSNYSDGVASIKELADYANRRGYEYIAICDHSQGLKIAGGLTSVDLARKKKEMDHVNKTSKARLLFGTEVDIDSAGKLDYPDRTLKEFDFVVAAIHSGFKQPKEHITKRIVSACKNPYVNVIAHPTGRLWGARDPYEFDFNQILKAAADYSVALEINCFPQRLDLNDSFVFAAKQAGVRLCLGTDSHRLTHLDFMSLGVSVARRGWLTKKDVINSMKFRQLSRWLAK